jgi:two-component system, NarL family, sensor kinase
LSNFKTYFFALLCFIVFEHTYSQSVYPNFKKDSLDLVSHFNAALNSSDSIFTLNELKKAQLVYASHKNELEDTYLFLKARYYLLIGKLDSSTVYINKGIELFTSHSKDIKKAKFLNLLGSVQSYQNEYTKSIESFQSAIEILDKNGNELLSAQIKSNISNIFFTINNFTEAYRYSLSSYSVLSKLKDTTHLPLVSSILGISALKIDSINQAKKYISKAVALSKQYKNPLGIIIGLYAEAELQFNQQQYTTAIDIYTQSLAVSLQLNALHYQMINHIGLATAYNQIKKYQEALIQSKKALVIAQNLQNNSPNYSIQKILSEAYFGLNKLDSAYLHLAIAHELFREKTKKENQELINELLIKYNSELQKKQLIEHELSLEKKENQLNSRNTWLLLLGLITLLLSIIFYGYRISVQKKLLLIKKYQQQKIFETTLQTEEKERERISLDLHDGIASNLAGLKLRMEFLAQENPSIKIDDTIHSIRSLQEETRKIAHNIMPIDFNKTSLQEAIRNYCQENQTPLFTIHYSCSSEVKIPISPIIAQSIYRIHQELVQNSLKHSDSTKCFVNLLVEDQFIHLTVEDEGKGMNIELQQSDAFLKSIKKRIEQLNGGLSIDSAPDKGTLIHVQFKILTI